MYVTWLTDSLAPSMTMGPKRPDSPLKRAMYFLPVNASPVTLR